MNATATAAIARPATGIAGNATPVLGELFLLVDFAAAFVAAAVVVDCAFAVVVEAAVVAMIVDSSMSVRVTVSPATL